MKYHSGRVQDAGCIYGQAALKRRSSIGRKGHCRFENGGKVLERVFLKPEGDLCSLPELSWTTKTVARTGVAS